MKERIQYLDFAKGLGIMLIVIGHHPLPDYLHNWIYSFHVPLFFIISGFFYRDSSIKQTFEKDLSRLVFPCFITGIVCIFSLSLVFLRTGSWKGPELSLWIKETFLCRGSFIIPGLWFLIALFYGKIIIALGSKLSIFLQFLLYFGLFVSSLYIAKLPFFEEIPFYLVQGLSCPLLLFLGNKMKSKEVIVAFPKNFYLMLAIGFIIVCGTYFPIGMLAFYYPYGVFSIFISVIISLAILIFCRIVTETLYEPISKKCINWVSHVGMNTIYVLCVHAWFHTMQFNGILDAYLCGLMGGILELFIMFGISFFLRKVINR